MALMSIVFAITGTMLLFMLKQGDYVSPLCMFSYLLSLLFLMVFLYALKRRPVLAASAEANIGKETVFLFKPKDFDITRDGQKLTLSYKAICGQYWCDSQYVLYLDDVKCKELINIPINEATFDDLYALAGALQRGKKRLIKISPKSKR